MLRRMTAVCLFAFVTSLAAVSRADAASVRLAWDPNPEPDIAGYTLYYGTEPGVYTASVNTGMVTEWQIDGLPESRTYYFAVRAYNTAGQVSDLSTEVSEFLATPVSAPYMSFDTPRTGAVVGTDFIIGGWAIDTGAPVGPGIDALHLWAFPTTGAPMFVGVVGYGGARADVASVFGSRFLNSGFNGRVVTLPPATYDLTIFAHSSLTGTFVDARSVRVAVQAVASRPVITIDTPGPLTPLQGSSSFLVAGWAIDLASVADSGIDTIHVWAYPNPGSGASPVWLGVPALGGLRADVAAVFGSQFARSGYNLIVGPLAPGTYRIVAFAHSTITGTFVKSTSVDVTIR